MGQQTSTVTRASDFDPTQARLTGADGGTPITTEIIYGQDDHGTDYKVFGDTSGTYMLWDESADFLKLVNAGIQIGTLSSTTQTGYPLTSTNNNVIDSFADDNNTTLGNAVYSNIRARTMLFKDATGISLFSIKGQIKCADEVDFGPGVFAGVQGYFETMDDTDIQSGAKVWGVDSSIESPSGGTVTVDSGGILSGLHAELTGAGEFVQSSTGILAGLYIDEQVTTGCWGYGIYIADSAATTGIDIGACTTGINISGAFTTAGITISDVTAMEGDAEAGVKIGSWGTPLNSLAAMTDNIRLYQGSLQVVDGPTSGYKEAVIFSGELQTDGSHDLDYADFSVIHTKTTIDKKLGWCYGAQHDVFKSGNDTIDDCYAVTAYLTTTGGPTFTAGRFAPVCAMLSASGGGPTITGDVFGIWVAIRGQAVADSALQIHVQSAATATNGIKIDQNGTMTNAMLIYGAVTNFLELDDASGFVTSGGTDCTASGATDPGYTLKCIMPDGGAGYIRVWDAA